MKSSVQKENSTENENCERKKPKKDPIKDNKAFPFHSNNCFCTSVNNEVDEFSFLPTRLPISLNILVYLTLGNKLPPQIILSVHTKCTYTYTDCSTIL